MGQEKLIVRDFVIEKLQSLDLTPDEEALKAVTSFVYIEEGDPIESEEKRLVTIKEDTDGKKSASSFKLYNLMKVSYYDFFKFLMGETSILFTSNTRAQAIISILNLVLEFFPKLEYNFNEVDAKILLAIYGLDKPKFEMKEVLATYALQEQEPISAERLKRSLKFFRDLKVLKEEPDGQFLVKEKITYVRE